VRDQEQRHQYDADAKPWVVREREDDSERRDDREASPEQYVAKSPRKSSEKWLLPFGHGGRLSSAARFGGDECLRVTRQHVPRKRSRRVCDRSERAASQIVVQESD
jgi:hypothetical protein